jgi:hypothetical protein
MSKGQLERIYFDTNAVFRWPNPPQKWWQTANLTTYTGTELFLPETVEGELEAQFLRRLGEIITAIRSSYRDFKVTCINTIPVPIPEFMAADEQRRHFRQRSEAIKALYNIKSVPLTKTELPLFVDMAINRKAPFEEKIVGKDKGRERFVTGLQDAVILFSVLDHMATASKDIRCAFVSDDDIFQKAEVRALIASRNIDLEIMRTPDAAFQDLWDHLWGEAKLALEKESQDILEELNTHKDTFADQVMSIMQPSQVRAGWFQRAVSINRVTILEISSVYPDFPPADHLPPRKYSRPDGSEVKITAIFKVDIRALVETSASSFNIFTPNDDDDEGMLKPPPAPEPPPSLSRKKYEQDLSVTLVGTALAGKIDDIHVIEVAPAKY